MAQAPKATVLDHFAQLDDPRVERTRRHKLVDILAIAICATICGADSWVHIELFGKSKLTWFQTFLELPHGIPSHDTFGAVFARLDPVQLQNSFMSWTQAIAELLPGEVVAIDGKTARRSYDRAGKKGAIHMVSAWATQQSLTLGQVKTDAKSNEITAIPQLLELLDLHGCIVTIDAGLPAGDAQDHRGRRRLRAGGDRCQDLFGAPRRWADETPYDHAELSRAGGTPGMLGHHRSGLPGHLDPQGQWPQLKAAVRVAGHRQTAEGGTSQPRYYISSLAGSAEQLLAAIRSHWSIENSLHWTLDVTFREDHCRVRKDHGPENINTLRQIGHNLLKNETTLKVGIQGKRLNAGWDEDYLRKVLLG